MNKLTKFKQAAMLIAAVISFLGAIGQIPGLPESVYAWIATATAALSFCYRLLPVGR